MATYTRTIAISLAPEHAGKTLAAQQLSGTAVNIGAEITATFTDLGGGSYLLTSSAFDDTAKAIKVYVSGQSSTVLALATLEYAGAAIDIASTTDGSTVANGKVRAVAVDAHAIPSASAKVMLSADQPDYKPAKAGDAMMLTTNERAAIASQVQAQIANDTGRERVLEAIKTGIAAAAKSAAAAASSANDAKVAAETASVDAAAAAESAESADDKADQVLARLGQAPHEKTVTGTFSICTPGGQTAAAGVEVWVTNQAGDVIAGPVTSDAAGLARFTIAPTRPGVPYYLQVKSDRYTFVDYPKAFIVTPEDGFTIIPGPRHPPA
jgi:hypothetical protein